MINMTIKIPKDLAETKPTLIGRFTYRQSGFFFIAIVFAYIGYQIEGMILPAHSGVITCLFALPWLLFGGYSPYGMPLEQYLKTIFISRMLFPIRRYYKVDNEVTRLLTNMDKVCKMEDENEADEFIRNNVMKKEYGILTDKMAKLSDKERNLITSKNNDVLSKGKKKKTKSGYTPYVDYMMPPRKKKFAPVPKGAKRYV